MSGGEDAGLTSAFGAIASYQICAGCGQFHGAASGVDGGGGLSALLNGDDRGLTGPNGKPSYTTFDAAAQITRSNTSWAGGLGQSATVTYAFRVSTPSMPTDTTGFSQFNSLQIAAAQLALAAWSDVANITFTRVTDAGSQYSNDATILFGNYSSGQSGAAAFAYLPGGLPGQTVASSQQGDVWINSSQGYNSTPVMQAYGQQVLLHEIGHAIGLSHPAAYNATAGGSITYGASAVYYEDSRQYTVMSYFAETYTGADFRTNGVGNTRYSAVPLLDDIAAAQRLYGANLTARTGNTTYGFNSNAGQSWFSATSAATALIFAVWDAGGTDTFDFSGYGVAQTIDLRQGAFSSVGGLVGNVAIAIGAVIENAIGGAAADNIRGNSAANTITGNGGNDIIDGGLGSDTVVFSGARAGYTITWNGQTGTVTGPGGTVTVRNVEFLQFSDQTVAAAPTGGLTVAGDVTSETISGTAFADTMGGLGGTDTINGLAGNDVLDGGSGDDSLNGGDDADLLIGGLGDDSIIGGAGVDIADYSGAGGGVTVSLLASNASGAAGNDTLVGIEEVRGSVHADSLTGDASDNVLRGNGGIDTMNGGGGADLLVAGAPGETGGAPDLIKAQGTANASIATAVSLAGRFDLGTRADVADSSSIPHATVVATTHGGMEYYAVTVAAGETVFFDIDNASFDTVLRILNASGTQLGQNDDAASDGGSSTDSSLSFTFAAAGTYYIQVSEWASGSEGDGDLGVTTPGAGETYTLHVSVPSAPTVPMTYLGATMNGDVGADVLEGGIGRDTLNGGGDDDLLTGNAGDDVIDGGAGTDIAVFSANRSAYTISTSAGVTTITGPNGVDTLRNVERLQFADGLHTIDGAPVTGGINGTPSADTLNGTADADVINGLEGDDVITGAAGNDAIDGGTGFDTAVFMTTIASSTVSTAGGTTTVNGPDGVDTLTNVEHLRFSDGVLIVGAGGGQYFAGTANLDSINGTVFNDLIEAAGGNDIIFAGAGSDVINGGGGTDTAVFAGGAVAYSVTTAGTVTTVGSSDGTDIMTNVEVLRFGALNLTIANLSGTTRIGANAGETLNGAATDDYLAGMGGADTLNGLDGDDILSGGGGVDVLNGGASLDTANYSGAAGAVTARLDLSAATNDGDGGTDTFTGVENLTGSAFNDLLVGNAAGNVINGGQGRDILLGFGGNDVLVGGTGLANQLQGGGGDDTYVVAESGDTIVELDGEGIDRVITALAQMTLGANVEDLTYVGTGAFIGGGNAGANTIRGGALRDTLMGFGGNDILMGGAGEPNNLFGGAGDDTYVLEAADSIIENVGEGADTVETATLAAYTLGANIENLTRTGSDAFVAGGNSMANVLAGGTGADVLRGRGGNDVLIGGAGADTADYSQAEASVFARLDNGIVSNDGDGAADTLSQIENLIGSAFDDTLFGNTLSNDMAGGMGRDILLGFGGNDILRGGAGAANQLQGGVGDDTYVVEERTDTIVELVGEGVDTVLTTVGQLNLSANVENLTFVGNGAFTGVGNGLGNTIRGGILRDTLVGLGGDDIIAAGAGAANNVFGGAGDDYYILQAADTVIENAGEGIDTVEARIASHTLRANVENLIFGGAGNFAGTGNALNNLIVGGAGNDTLRGGGGTDQIQGGGGSDTLVLLGAAADYSVTAEGAGWRIVDSVGGRDGSILTTSIEFLRYGNGSTVALGAPPPAPLLTEKQIGDAFALPADDAFLALPAADALVAPEGPQVLPEPAFIKAAFADLFAAAHDPYVVDGPHGLTLLHDLHQDAAARDPWA